MNLNQYMNLQTAESLDTRFLAYEKKMKRKASCWASGAWSWRGGGQDLWKGWVAVHGFSSAFTSKIQSSSLWLWPNFYKELTLFLRA